MSVLYKNFVHFKQNVFSGLHRQKPDKRGQKLRALKDYFVHLKTKVSNRGIVLDHITNVLFKVVLFLIVIVEFNTKILRISEKMLSVGDKDNN